MAIGTRPQFELNNSIFSFSTSRLNQPATVTRGASFEAQAILNRSSPIFTFASSNPKTLNILLPIYKIDEDDGNIVTDMIMAVESIVVPEKPGTKPPPLCTVNLYSSHVLRNFKCLLFNYFAEIAPDQRFDENGAPLSVNISCTFVGIEMKAVSSSEIYSGGSYRQVSRP